MKSTLKIVLTLLCAGILPALLTSPACAIAPHSVPSVPAQGTVTTDSLPIALAWLLGFIGGDLFAYLIGIIGISALLYAVIYFGMTGRWPWWCNLSWIFHS